MLDQWYKPFNTDPIPMNHGWTVVSTWGEKTMQLNNSKGSCAKDREQVPLSWYLPSS